VSSEPPTKPKSNGSPFRVLRNRNFALLFSAGATSTGGFSLGQVALTWLVFVTTGSTLDIAYLALSSTMASILLSLVGGTLVDRHNRRILMILSDLVRALGLGVLAAYLYFVGFSLPLVLAVSFILGSFSTIFSPAERSLTPAILSVDEVVGANGLVQITTSMFQSLANAAGGALVAVIGAVAALGINSATFAISASLIASMTLGSAARSHLVLGAQRKSFLNDVAEGIHYLPSNKGLFHLTLSAGILNLFFAMLTPYVVVYAAKELNGGAIVYGSLLATFAIGLGPGALLVGRTNAVAHAGKIWGLSGFFTGLAILLLSVTRSFIIALVLFLVVGILSGYGNVTWLSTVQLIVPSEMQGRYFGVDQLGSFAVVPVGQVLGALVIQVLNVQIDYLIVAIGLSVTSLGFLLSKELRALGYSAIHRQE